MAALGWENATIVTWAAVSGRFEAAERERFAGLPVGDTYRIKATKQSFADVESQSPAFLCGPLPVNYNTAVVS